MSGQAAFNKPVRPAELCEVEARNENSIEGEEGIELNGIEEEQDKMSDDEEELAAPDWRVKAGPRSKPTLREREEHEATRVPFRDWCAYCMMGRGRTHHHVMKKKSEDQSRRPVIAMDYFFMKLDSSPNAQEFSEEPVTCIGQISKHHEQCGAEERS